MDGIFKFGSDLLGLPKEAALVIFLFIFIFRSLKKHIDTLRAEKTGKISEMIAEINKADKKPRYHFVVEQVFQNRFRFLIDYPAIKFFLCQKTPSHDIARYIRGYRYLEFNEDYSKLGYKKKRTKNKLKMKSYVHLALYIFFSFLGLAMIAAIPQMGIDGSTGFAMYLLLTLSFLIFATMSLSDSTRHDAAIALVEKFTESDN